MDELITFSRGLSATAQCCAGIGPRPGLAFIPWAQRVGRRDMQSYGWTPNVFATWYCWYPTGRGALLLLWGDDGLWALVDNMDCILRCGCWWLEDSDSAHLHPFCPSDIIIIQLLKMSNQTKTANVVSVPQIQSSSKCRNETVCQIPVSTSVCCGNRTKPYIVLEKH